MQNELEDKTLVVNKKNFSYVEKGKGSMVILVHGWPETWMSWTNQISFISSLGFKVIAFNTRGYPGSYSPKNIADYSMKYYMEDLIDIINFFEEKEVILIGHDWGAPICWNTAAYYKKRISAVIGLSVPFTRRGTVSSSKLWKELYKDIFFYQNYFQKLNIPEKELEVNVTDALKKVYYWLSAEGYLDSVKTSPKINSGLLDGLPYPNKNLPWLNIKDLKVVSDKFKKHGLRGSINRYRAQDIDWEELKELDYLKISQPSLFIGGEYDAVRFFIKDYDAYKNPEKYCDDFRGKYIINNAGHWVQQEKAEEVNEAIKKFLFELY